MYGQSVSMRTICVACKSGCQWVLTFQTIFPGRIADDAAYPLRGLPSVSSATAASNKITTSQLALPKDICVPFIHLGYEPA